MSEVSGRRSEVGVILICLLALNVRADWPVPPQPGVDLPPASFEVEKRSLEELFFKAQVYATTPQKRADKQAARNAFFAQGPDAFAYLMDNIHIANLWIRVMAFELVRQLSGEDAVPVLLKHLTSPEETQQKYAIFFLGFFGAPEDAPDLTDYLDDDTLQGGAIRTLGKWKSTGDVPRLIPFLQHDKERIRIMTANALRDIGDPSAEAALTEALQDEFFTVRKTAERALEQLKKSEDKTPSLNNEL